MIPVQPYNIFAYISKKNTYKTGKNIKELNYLSWEDAVWDIIKYKNIPKGSTALIPSFWCGHVVKNLRNHGVICQFYDVDENFQTSEELLMQRISELNPLIVVVLHAVGIENKLITENNNWIKSLPRETILIEDSVHSVINPSKLKIRKTNHFIIDSWRKVMPLQGAAMNGSKSDVDWSEPPLTQSFFYSLSIFLLWIIFQLALWAESKNRENMAKIAKMFGMLAEYFMIKGYDIIGEDDFAAATLPIFVRYRKRLNYEKIEKIKKSQVEKYESKLSEVFETNIVQKVSMSEKDKGRLRGFPIIMNLERAEEMLRNLRKNGLFVRFELNDSPWSKLRKVIYLPLGPQLTTRDVDKVINIVRSTNI
ncbi:MAG: hypothetical protein U0525_02910 [Patescibacteria group bacterium]